MGTPMTTLGDRTAWLGRRTAHSEAHIPFNDLNAERHEGCRSGCPQIGREQGEAENICSF
jgi:hypothetical protein